MTTEYARVESLVNVVLAKPVTVVVYAILVSSRWTVKRFARLVGRWRCKGCIKPICVQRR